MYKKNFDAPKVCILFTSPIFPIFQIQSLFQVSTTIIGTAQCKKAFIFLQHLRPKSLATTIAKTKFQIPIYDLVKLQKVQKNSKSCKIEKKGSTFGHCKMHFRQPRTLRYLPFAHFHGCGQAYKEA